MTSTERFAPYLIVTLSLLMALGYAASYIIDFVFWG